MYHTRLQVTCHPEFSEILIAELSEAGFDTFLENENGFEAYAEGEAYNTTLVEDIRKKYQPATPVAYAFSRIEKKNWNEEWEKSYVPIVVNNKCLIRASFHQPDKRYPYEIIITPKMSFGTGHHQTTYLMLKTMMEMEYMDKRVMDAGCGTAILSIMASKLGAREVEAFDIDGWSVENGNENAAVNQCKNIRIRQGSISEVDLSGKFDIILANINKNVLLQELHIYASFLKAGGLLLISGFLSLDIPDLLGEAHRHDFKEAGRDERETWASLLLQIHSRLQKS
jgi:ribosomal protein L11 methyltransferase